MNKIKSIVLTLNWLLAINLAFSAINHWLQDGRIAWWGSVIVAVGFVSKPLLLHLGGLVRDDARASVATGITLLGLAFTILMDAERGAPLAWSFVAAVNVFIHTYWSTTISPGRKLGHGIEAWASLQQSPQLMIFLRGKWCPYSHAARRQLPAFLRNHVPPSVDVTVVTDKPVANEQRQWKETNSDIAGSMGLLLRGGMPWGLHWFKGRDAICPALVLLGDKGEIGYIEIASSLREPLNIVDPAPKLLRTLAKLGDK